MRYKIDWPSLWWEGNSHFCIVLLCIRKQIPSTTPTGAYIRRGDLRDGFVRYDFGGLILGGARSRYSAPGGAYFRNFMVWKCTNHCDFFSVGLLRTMCILSCVTFV